MAKSHNWLPLLRAAIPSDVSKTNVQALRNVVKSISYVYIIISFFSLLSCADSKIEENKPVADAGIPDVKNELEGAWELVSTTDKSIANIKKPLQLKLFVDGYFVLIMKDSTGKWNLSSGGTYETNGNVYKETHLYPKQPEFAGFLGYTDWQEYEIKGDTLYKRLFTKVVNSKGEDITAQFPSDTEEKRVRVKK